MLNTHSVKLLLWTVFWLSSSFSYLLHKNTIKTKMTLETQDFLHYKPWIRILIRFSGECAEPGFMQKKPWEMTSWVWITAKKFNWFIFKAVQPALLLSI